MKKIIVVADDFGLSPEIDKAILQLADKGIVTHAALVACSKNFDHIIAEIKKRPQLKVGVHLNLTDGDPVLGSAEIPTLIKNAGRFYGGRHYAVAAKIISGQMKAHEILKEWRAQINKIRQEGIQVNFLNSHGHLHLIPRLHKVLSSLLEEFDIKYMRLIFSGKSAKARIFRYFSKKLLKYIQNNGKDIDFPRKIIGIDHQGHLKKETILSEIRRDQEGITEIITHPSIGENPYHKRWGYLANKEYDNLTDNEVVRFLHKEMK